MKYALLLAAILILPLPFSAQTTTPDSAPKQAEDKVNSIEQRINVLTDKLNQTQKALQDSLLEIQRLRGELNELKANQSAANPVGPTNTQAAQPAPAPGATPTTEELEALHEQMDMLAAEIKQHDQTKVETASKYQLRVTGLLLFNAYSNAGVVDDADLPTYALTRFPNGSHGSMNATLRQTILGIEAHGPTLGGAQTSAALNIDFFGGSVSNTSGYAASAGYVRLRNADIAMDWENTTLQAGYNEPLISPQSPSSYATVAHPALAGSGNLWAWAPQLRIDRRLPFGEKHAIGFEGGLIFPFASNYSNNQLNSPVSAARRPGVEGRLSYRADRSADAPSNSLTFGVSGYHAQQFYSGGFHVPSWAVTGDYNIPITHFFNLSGEAYRGNAIGGLGGGGYNDVLFANDYSSTAAVVRAVEAAGGWAQLKTRFSSRIEANMMYGIDDSFKRNLDDITLPTGTSTLATIGRNQTFSGNLIFHLRSNLIFSPEYRHIETWYYKGPSNVANIFTLSGGYQF